MIDIGLDRRALEQMHELLNFLLAHEYVLYTKSLNFHWNVRGPHFGALHAFFKQQYEDLFGIVDDIAERVATLAGKPFASLHEFLSHSRLQESSINAHLDDQEMLRQLYHDHETVIKVIRRGIDISAQVNDMGTNNFLCDLIEKQEKMAWMVRAHLVVD